MNIFKLIKKRRLQDIREYVRSGKNIEEKLKNGSTPLIAACACSFADIAKILIDSGADINARKGDGYTPLTYACKNRCLPLAICLLEHHAKMDMVDFYGTSILRRAIWAGHLDIIKLLIDNGADVNFTEEGHSQLCILSCVSTDNLDSFNLLLKAGADLNQRDINGEAPLHQSMRMKKKAVQWFQTLLEAGADVNVKGYSGNSALHNMSWLKTPGSLSILELAVKYQFDLNMQNDRGNTILINLISENNHECVKKLLEFGVDTSLKNEWRYTPLKWAAVRQAVECFEILLDSYKDHIGFEEMKQDAFLSSTMGSAMVTCMLRHCDTVNFTDKNGNTPLMIACRSVWDDDKIKAIQLLLEHGAEVSMVNYENRSAMHMANEISLDHYRKRTTNLLLKYRD